MSKNPPDRPGKSRLLPALAGLFLLAWVVAVIFAVRDTFVHDRQGGESAESSASLALAERNKGRFPILDRGGRELAVSFPAKSVYARPLEVDHPDAVALFLARELGLPERELRRDLKEERSFVWLGRQISETAVNSIRERNLRGIYVVDETQRFYPQGEMAAQLLGVAREGRGLTGIEAQFDQQLQTMVDLPEEKGTPHGPLLLTLDLRIQELLERELAQVAGETGATGGEGLVLDARTGEVLALANLPAFEPNFFGDSDENSRTNRVLSLALPASGFGQLLRMTASSQPVPIEIPAPVVNRPAPKRDRLAALKKELRKKIVSHTPPPPATFGSGPGRLLPCKGGYRSPGLAGLDKVAEPPGFAQFTGSLGFGQKDRLELPVGVVQKAAVGDPQPTFRATGGELLSALASLVHQDGTLTPRVVTGVVDPKSGQVQALPEPAVVGGGAAEPAQRLRDYLNRLATGPEGNVFLEELTEQPPPVQEEAPAAATGEENGRAVGQAWEPEQAASLPPGAEERTTGVSPEHSVIKGQTAVPLPPGSGQGKKLPAGGGSAEQENQAVSEEAERTQGPRHFVSLLVALPGGGQTSEVLLLLALEGAVLDPAAASPLRLAAERLLPQIRTWAAENIGQPASVSWSANESLWQSQWQKVKAAWEAKASQISRPNQRLMPDLHGASLRKALQVLGPYDLKLKIQGVGRVVEQRPAAGEKLSGEECLLILSGLNLINERPAREVAVGMESGTDKLKIFSSISNPRPVTAGGH